MRQINIKSGIESVQNDEQDNNKDYFVLTSSDVEKIRNSDFDGINKPEERNTSWSTSFEDFAAKRKRNDIMRRAKGLEWNFNFNVQQPEDHAKLIIEYNPLYYDKTKRWWRWDSESLFWRETFEPDIINFIKKFFQAQGMSSSTNRTTILNAIKDESQNNKPKAPKDTWIQIGSKIYDIASNEVIQPKPEYFVKTAIPYDLGESEETPFIDGLFNDWKPETINGDDSFETLQEITAYAMSPVQFLDSFYFLQGRGSDGKSKFLNLLTIMVGDIDEEDKKHKNTYHGDIEKLSDPSQRFETIRLQNKLLAILGDGNFGVIKHSKILKEACGNTDKIRAELKGSTKTDLDFYNKAKIMCAFNTLPETQDKTKGFYRRVHLTFWNQEFTGEVDVIREFKERHFHEINNLLKKSLRILREMYKRNRIKGMYNALDWTKTKDVYEQHANPLKQFIKAETKADIKGCFSAAKFYSEYSKWAENNGFNSFTFDEVNKRLKSMNLDYMQTYVYQMPDGFIFRDKEKAFNYWQQLVDIDNADEYLFEREIAYERVRLYRGFTFNKQMGDN